MSDALLHQAKLQDKTMSLGMHMHLPGISVQEAVRHCFAISTPAATPNPSAPCSALVHK